MRICFGRSGGRIAIELPSSENLDDLWARHHAEWRDSAQVASQWRESEETDPRLLTFTTQGHFWETIADASITVLITREYEHLVLAARSSESGPAISYMRLPHPSGLAVDRRRGIVHIASTRNPNQVYDLAPVHSLVPRRDVEPFRLEGKPLVPIRSRYYPGCTYIHDLAVVDDQLYANAVGQNAIVRLRDCGGAEVVWWPRSIERDGVPMLDLNYLQLNSIAAGTNLCTSFFSASAAKPSARRPGHKNFPVDRRGVIFSGATREPVVLGLTRPHSARLHDGRIWVDNSGYGEIGFGDDGRFHSVARLPGWTRGLCFHEDVAFVGTSRVLPRFRQYAPGLEVDASACGIHAIDVHSGRVLGSLLWPHGNQIFAIAWLPTSQSSGLPFPAPGNRARAAHDLRLLYYSFDVERSKHTHE